jgi:hypothetical protein
MAAIALAIVLFVTGLVVLRWIAVVLVLATIPALMWTLVHPPGRDA